MGHVGHVTEGLQRKIDTTPAHVALPVRTRFTQDENRQRIRTLLSAAYWGKVGEEKPSVRQHVGNAGVPNGIRTRVATLKEWSPRPLDDGDGGGLCGIRPVP